MEFPFDNVLGDPELGDDTAGSNDRTSAGGRRRHIRLPTLYGQRDSLLDLLASSWEEIALRVDRFRRMKSLGLEDVRETFQPLKNEFRSYLLIPVLRDTTVPTTAKAIRRLREELQDLAGRKGQTEKQYVIQRERLRTAKGAFKRLALEGKESKDDALKRAAQREKESIKSEMRQRCIGFQNAKAALDDALKQLDLVERNLADQEAFFAQTEVLRFLKSGRNRLDPKRLADAMAGLPRLGCRRSSKLCAKQSSLLWPHPHYQMLREVERIWRLVDLKDQASASEIFRKEIIALPKKAKGKNEAHLRVRLCQNWRYLKLAIVECVQKKIDAREMPHRIVASFMAYIAQPRDALESMYAEREAL